MASRIPRGDDIVSQIEEEPNISREEEESLLEFSGDMEKTVSTRSDLADLAISGGIKWEGGIPYGIIMEVSGLSSTGKTQLMGEICSAGQRDGSRVKIGDVEGKFVRQYALRYGLKLEEGDVTLPDTPQQLFSEIMKLDCDIYGADSVAALVASAEMVKESNEEDTGKKKRKKKTEEGNDNTLIKDKMGGMKPKEIHALMRKTARMIKNRGMLLIFTNQLHDTMSTYGPKKKTSGGNAIPYFSMLRISIDYVDDIVEEVEIPRRTIVKEGNKEVEKIVTVKESAVKGIICEMECFKNHIDDPFRTAPLRIRFGYGFDNIGANLQWLKEKLGENSYIIDGKKFRSLYEATRYIEKNNLESKLTKQVREIWHGIQDEFEKKYKRKERV